MSGYDIGSRKVTKRLPIVFCLDVSPSMRFPENTRNTPINLLNISVKNFIEELSKHPKASAAVEISFVTFSDNIEVDSAFESLQRLNFEDFSTVEFGGTQISKAVIHSINKIEEQKRKLERGMIPYYAPFLVLITDGDPDEIEGSEAHKKALDMVQTHCDSATTLKNMIIPFIIGVGDNIHTETLNKYSAGFASSYFPVRGDESNLQRSLTKVFQLISNSALNSVNQKNPIKTIRDDMDEVLKKFLSE